MAIKFGIKIKKFIEIMNSTTSQINRGIKGSPCIYLVEKTITQPEMVITNEENMRPEGSIINLMDIVLALIDRIDHSIINTLFK